MLVFPLQIYHDDDPVDSVPGPPWERLRADLRLSVLNHNPARQFFARVVYATLRRDGRSLNRMPFEWTDWTIGYQITAGSPSPRRGELELWALTLAGVPLVRVSADPWVWARRPSDNGRIVFRSIHPQALPLTWRLE